MRQGFVKVAAVTPKIKVADTKYNAELILDMMKESTRQGAKIVVFPELCFVSPDIPVRICFCRNVCCRAQRMR